MRSYILTLRAEAPVFVGDGNRLGKKEYLFLPVQNRVYVPDMTKMFRDFQKRGLMDAYADYLLNDRRRDFAAWLREKGVMTPRQIPGWTAYWMDSGDAVLEERGRREILTFQKDAYGCPYVPGSGLKGMLRTMILGTMILRDREALRAEARSVQNADLRKSRTQLLRREADQLEQRYLHTLNRKDVPLANKVNDMMSGLRVSDSRPLSTDDLILCQKIDLTHDGQRKPLPILRECIRPGTEVVFDLTVEPALCPFTAKELLEAAERWKRAYDQEFRGKFPTRDIKQGGTVYLGGGCGYATKTFAYPLLGGGGADTVGRIIDATLPRQVRDQHKHFLDARIAHVSPHMLKCTQYQKQLYEMGACSLVIQEKTG